MEITSTMLYLISRLDNIQIMSVLFIITGIIMGTIGCIVYTDNYSGNQAFGKKVFTISIIIVIINSLISVLIPTTKEMATIIILPRIVNSDSIEQIQKDSGELYGLALEKLKEMLKKEKEIENNP